MRGSDPRSPERSEARRRSSRPALRSSPPFAPLGVARSSSCATLRYSGSSLEVRPRRLPSAQVDPQLLGGAEHVLVRLAELDLLPRRRANLDVQAERLHLLDQDLEGLGDPRLGDVLALHDRLIDLDASEHVVGLDREEL